MTISRSVIMPTSRSLSPTGSEPASMSAMRLAASRIGLIGAQKAHIASHYFADFHRLCLHGLQPAGNVSAAAQPGEGLTRGAAPIWL